MTNHPKLYMIGRNSDRLGRRGVRPYDPAERSAHRLGGARGGQAEGGFGAGRGKSAPEGVDPDGQTLPVAVPDWSPLQGRKETAG